MTSYHLRESIRPLTLDDLQWASTLIGWFPRSRTYRIQEAGVYIERHHDPRFVQTWRCRERRYATSEGACQCRGFGVRRTCAHVRAVEAAGGVLGCQEKLRLQEAYVSSFEMAQDRELSRQREEVAA